MSCWSSSLVSGILEAVWATALGKSEGFTKLWPSIIFGVALVASMGGLAWAMRDISTGTAYAVWVGIGASLTVAYAMITGDEPFSIVQDAAHPGPGRRASWGSSSWVTPDISRALGWRGDEGSWCVGCGCLPVARAARRPAPWWTC